LDNDSLQRAQSALVDLRQYYVDGLASLEKNFEAAKDLHEKLQLQFSNQAAELSNTIVPRTETDIEANKQNSDAKQNELTDTEANLTYQNGQLKAEDDSWALRVESHDLLVPKYDEEFAVVE